MRDTYEVGDRCWLLLHGVEEPVEGRVSGSFTLPTQTVVFYIIQVVQGHHAYLEVRDASLLSRRPDALIPRISYIHQEPTLLRPQQDMH